MSTAEQTAAAAASTQTTEGSLLETIVDRTKPLNETERVRNKSVIDEFLRKVVQPGQVVSKDVETNIKFWVSEIDKKLTGQLNEIMHHPDFQKLEATWRGLHYLVHETLSVETLRIRVLNVSKKELFRDLERAPEFDQSGLFKKVYEDEYGILGGTPYGLLIGDYEFSRTAEDVSLLKMISAVASQAHAPFVAAASSQLFNLENYTELTAPRDLAKIFQSVEYAAWRSFRESDESRYAALTLPHVLARLPYGAKFKTIDAFQFEETVDGREHDKYLWMNAAWAYGALVINAYAQDGWFARTRGVEGGGKVQGLPVHTFPTDDGDIAMKCPTEIAISDRREFELSNLGFLPILHAKNTDFAVFMGTQSCQKAKQYTDADANANAELSTKLNYMLCVSRFAHYLKVMARDRIGSFTELKECENWLNDWINQFVVTGPSVGASLKAQYPLAAARVEVQAVKGKPGWYNAVAWLRPHYQLEALSCSFRLVAEVPQKAG